MEEKKKINVEIFVPLDSCACLWNRFMNSMFAVLTPYMKYINFETKNINSKDARERNIFGNCIVIDKEKKFITSFILKKKLPELLSEKGFIDI